MQILGATGLSGFVAITVGAAYSRNKLALRTRLRNLNLRSHFSMFDSFRDIRVQIYDFFKFGIDISIGIDKNNTFQLKFVF